MLEQIFQFFTSKHNALQKCHKFVLTQRAYEIQFISSDQTQKHSPIAAESFLPFKFHFNYDLIYLNEIPDIRQKVMASVIKYWNQIQFFSGRKFKQKSKNSPKSTCFFFRYSKFHDDTRLTLSIRGAVRNFMQIFTHKATLPNTWKFAVLSFFNYWQNVYFYFQIELILRQSFAAHFQIFISLVKKIIT